MFFLAPTPQRWHSFLQLWGLTTGVPLVVLGLLGVHGLLSGRNAGGGGGGGSPCGLGV